MPLTNEQLESIKTKIQTDKIKPIRAIKELFPNEPFDEVRRQLFNKYKRSELIALSNPQTTPPTKEEKLEIINKRISQMDLKKEKLLQKKTQIESEE